MPKKKITKDDNDPDPTIDEKEIERERGPYVWMVEKKLVKFSDPVKKKMAIALILFQQREPKTPLLAWDAVILSGKLELPAPSWAIDILEKIQNDRTTGKISDLDETFGFKASRGKTPEVHKILLEERNDRLLWDVWKLNLLGYTVDKACKMVAKKLQSVENWNKTNYDIDFNKIAPGQPKEEQNYLSVAETLRKIYWKWKRNNSDCLQPETVTKIHSNLLKEDYLSKFPTD